ncbi:MAG: zf-HC2 domain-containing protein [Elusimicrobia bacterium]|nr:zf-HC2 domain-containing protein [Elusimicrobiota bacterium]
MTHDLPIETLFAYRDGEMNPVQSAAVRTHLAQCPACRDVLEKQELIFLPFRDVPAPAGFAERVMAQVENPERSSWRAPLGLRPWAWAGGLAFAGALFLALPRSSGPRPTTGADLSMDLTYSGNPEEEAGFGTEIEASFL